MPILFRKGVTGAKGKTGRWRLVVDGVGGWGLDRRGVTYVLIDHHGEQISEGSFDKCLDDAEVIAKMGVESAYAEPES